MSGGSAPSSSQDNGANSSLSIDQKREVELIVLNKLLPGGVVAATVGIIFGWIGSTILPDSAIRRANSSAEHAEQAKLDLTEILKGFKVEGWPLAIICARGGDSFGDRIYYLTHAGVEDAGQYMAYTSIYPHSFEFQNGASVAKYMSIVFDPDSRKVLGSLRGSGDPEIWMITDSTDCRMETSIETIKNDGRAIFASKSERS